MSDNSGTEYLSHEERALIVRRHFERKGYRVHSGLQFGCELVLYADDPDKVHSDFCVHIVPTDSQVNWMQIQILARSMATLHKQLIIVNVHPTSRTGKKGSLVVEKPLLEDDHGNNEGGESDDDYFIAELAIASGHAPFRHKRKEIVSVGSQIKQK
jgi:tRNA splicing endonuclease